MNELITMDKIFEIFVDKPIEHPFLDELALCHGDQERFEKLAKEHPNALSKWYALEIVYNFEPQSKVRDGFINLMRHLIVASEFDAYSSSRIGWINWFFNLYIRPDTYYPMKWYTHFHGPDWYKLGETFTKKQVPINAKDAFRVQFAEEMKEWKEKVKEEMFNELEETK